MLPTALNFGIVWPSLYLSISLCISRVVTERAATVPMADRNAPEWISGLVTLVLGTAPRVFSLN